MVEPSNIQPDTGLINPQEVAGNFGLPIGKPVLSDEPSESNQKNQTIPKKNKGYGLTPKQQLKQDAALWAEFLYSEYKREKALKEGAQTMPTHYDNSDA